MTQKHYAQHGLFHVTTNTKDKVPWCTWSRVPEILIDNLCMTRNVQRAKVFAFCILPDHMHVMVAPGNSGLSAFMHSFKRNAMRDIRASLSRSGRSRSSATECVPHWQKSYHDESILDDDQRGKALWYIRYNAIRHGLVDEISDWPWTSLHFPRLMDQMEIWV